jgi:hypothetical protein
LAQPFSYFKFGDEGFDFRMVVEEAEQNNTVSSFIIYIVYFPNVIGINKSVRMLSVENTARNKKKINLYIIFVGKHEGRRPPQNELLLGRSVVLV